MLESGGLPNIMRETNVINDFLSRKYGDVLISAIFDLFDTKMTTCHLSWIIDENIVNFENDHDFWVPRAKDVRSTKFYQSSLIIPNVMRPSVKLTVPLGETCTRVTSRLCNFYLGVPLTIENRNIQTLITHETSQNLKDPRL